MRRISPPGFRIARRRTSREINRQIALNLIRSKQPTSRADLACLMGMRRGAVSRLVDELLEAGLVFEGSEGESRHGRKPTHLHIETRRRCVAAADISAPGCWEAYASKRGTIARYRGTEASWPESGEEGPVTIEDVIAAARAGEAKAPETLRETGYYLGRGFATIVKTIDPKRIYVGGEITEAWDLIAGAVRDARREDAVVREGGETEILTVALGEYPRLRGAAALIHAPAFAAADVSTRGGSPWPRSRRRSARPLPLRPQHRPARVRQVLQGLCALGLGEGMRKA